MRRREFIAGLGVAAWPAVAQGQQTERDKVGALLRLGQPGWSVGTSIVLFFV
jgi:hypothetical protein